MERRRELREMEGEVNHERLWTLKNNLRVLEGQGMGSWVSLVVGIMEGTYCMEHWVWCKNNEFCYAEKKLKKKIVSEWKGETKSDKDERNRENHQKQ